MTLFNRKKLCIFCGKTKFNQCIHTHYENIGICEECYSQLVTTKDMCFEGGKYVKTVFSPYLYEGKIRDIVKAFKFAGQKCYGELCGILMTEKLKHLDLIKAYDCIIPIPLHSNRFCERGYNQSEVLAHSLSEKWGIPICDDYVFRIKDTLRQSSLKGLERKQNVKNAFYAEDVVKGKNIILIDDIYTMGETVNACAMELSEKGAKEILAISLCKTVKKELNEYVDLR